MQIFRVDHAPRAAALVARAEVHSGAAREEAVEGHECYRNSPSQPVNRNCASTLNSRKKKPRKTSPWAVASKGRRI
jgi:hypothetical protein